MAEDNFTLTTFYASWKEYQDNLKKALAPLTAEQLELRAAPHLRSVGEIALHIVGCRAYWFIQFLGEDGGEEMKVYTDWNEMAVGLAPRTSSPTASELVQGLDYTWQFMADCLARWRSADMQQTFPDEWDGQQVDLSRARVVWYVMFHDMHHGGEISLTLGIQDIPSFPG